jgi:site-specific DNA-methyltransferase (adenine-specific)
VSRVETIGGATLYLGDCREILPALGKVAAVVTDPPYGTKVTEWDISIDPETVGRILGATDGYSVFYYSNTRLAHLLNAVRDHGRDAWVAVWHKSNAMGFERRFAPQWVPVVIAYRGNPPFWGKDLFACPIRVQKDVDHPTPKQPAMTEWLVERSSKSGDLILDPFMGSGTTGIACAKLGRDFTGIEIEEKYFDLACRRIEAATKQSELFA